MPQSLAGTIRRNGDGILALPATVPVPGLAEASKRLARLADLEQQANEEELWETAKRARARRAQILTELQSCLDNWFGSKVLCPLCDPTYLDLYPLPNDRLRNCVSHSLPILLTLGRLPRSENDSTSSPGLLSVPFLASSMTKNFGAKRSINYASFRLALAVIPRKMPSAKPISSE